MATLSVNYHDLYKEGLQELLTQTVSRLRPLVMVESMKGGDTLNVDQVRGATVSEVANLSAATVFSNIQTARRQIKKKNYYYHELVTDDQLNNVPYDPKAPLIRRVISAFGEKMDEIIYNGAVGSADTGHDGSTPVTFDDTTLDAGGTGRAILDGGTNATYPKLLEACEFFRLKDYEGRRLIHICHPSALTAYYNIDKVIDNDFSRLHEGGLATPMSAGYEFTLKLGYNIDVFTSNKVAVTANIADNLIMTPEGVGFGIGMEPTVWQARNPERNMQMQFSVGSLFGATRLDEDQVVKIKTDTTA